MYIISMILLIIFAVVGLCAFLTAIMDMCCCSCKGVTIILDKLEADNAEAQVRRAARMYKETCHARLICVCNTDDPAHDICELMKNEYPFLELVRPEDIRIP